MTDHDWEDRPVVRRNQIGATLTVHLHFCRKCGIRGVRGMDNVLRPTLDGTSVSWGLSCEDAPAAIAVHKVIRS